MYYIVELHFSCIKHFLYSFFPKIVIQLHIGSSSLNMVICCFPLQIPVSLAEKATDFLFFFFVCNSPAKVMLMKLVKYAMDINGN